MGIIFILICMLQCTICPLIITRGPHRIIFLGLAKLVKFQGLRTYYGLLRPITAYYGPITAYYGPITVYIPRSLENLGSRPQVDLQCLSKLILKFP